jgi:hypothetical protein
MKLSPLGAELFHAGGRTDGRTDGQAGRRTGRQAGRETDVIKLIVVFGNFANAPKNGSKVFWNVKPINVKVICDLLCIQCCCIYVG